MNFSQTGERGVRHILTAGLCGLAIATTLSSASAQTGQTGGMMSNNSRQRGGQNNGQSAGTAANRGIPPALVNRLDGLTMTERATLSRVLQRLNPDEQRVMVKALTIARTSGTSGSTGNQGGMRRGNRNGMSGTGGTGRQSATGAVPGMSGNTTGTTGASGTSGTARP